MANDRFEIPKEFEKKFNKIFPAVFTAAATIILGGKTDEKEVGSVLKKMNDDIENDNIPEIPETWPELIENISKK